MGLRNVSQRQILLRPHDAVLDRSQEFAKRPISKLPSFSYDFPTLTKRILMGSRNPSQKQILLVPLMPFLIDRRSSRSGLSPSCRRSPTPTPPSPRESHGTEES
jgi:hypothetical protein